MLLQAHSASLEMTFYPAAHGPAAFPAAYDGDIFAAEHGSWNRSVRTGYKIVRARLHHGIPTGEYDDFMTGFVVDNRNVWGRPVGGRRGPRRSPSRHRRRGKHGLAGLLRRALKRARI